MHWRIRIHVYRGLRTWLRLLSPNSAFTNGLFIGTTLGATVLSYLTYVAPWNIKIALYLVNATVVPPIASSKGLFCSSFQLFMGCYVGSLYYRLLIRCEYPKEPYGAQQLRKLSTFFWKRNEESFKRLETQLIKQNLEIYFPKDLVHVIYMYQMKEEV